MYKPKGREFTMEINAKKMKTVVIGKNEEVKCGITTNGARLEYHRTNTLAP